MERKITDWRDEGQVSRDDFYILAPLGESAFKHNVYVERYGYVDNHILKLQRRDNPDHWNGQFKNAAPFQEEWRPRSGPLELVYNLVELQGHPFRVINLGAGLGDFTIDLARIPGVVVDHVDFSTTANQVAKENVNKSGVENKVEIVTMENRNYLRNLMGDGVSVDFVFVYGGLAENTPLVEDIAETLEMAGEVLKPGGHFWIVGLEQPFLSGEGEREVSLADGTTLGVSDIPGEYPVPPGLLRELMISLPNIYLVADTSGPRPDSHPLRPGGPSEEHAHVVYRGLFAKEMPNGQRVHTPNFDFKKAVNPDWKSTWRQLKQL